MNKNNKNMKKNNSKNWYYDMTRKVEDENKKSKKERIQEKNHNNKNIKKTK